MVAKLHIGLLTSVSQSRRFLDVATEIPDELLDPWPLRWLEGVSWEPLTTGALTAESADAPCDEKLIATVARTCTEALIQKPFRLNDAFKSPTLNMPAAEAADRLLLDYGLRESAAFASELLSGAASTGYSLAGSATAPNLVAFGAASVSVGSGLAVLEEEYAERTQGKVGYLHLSPGMLAAAVAEYALQQDPSGNWVTPAGNVVISDAGYAVPPPPSGQAASTAGKDWVYISGPVLWKKTDPVVFPSLSLDRNEQVFRVEGHGIVVFDTAPVSAVLVQYA